MQLVDLKNYFSMSQDRPIFIRSIMTITKLYIRGFFITSLYKMEGSATRKHIIPSLSTHIKCLLSSWACILTKVFVELQSSCLYFRNAECGSLLKNEKVQKCLLCCCKTIFVRDDYYRSVRRLGLLIQINSTGNILRTYLMEHERLWYHALLNCITRSWPWHTSCTIKSLSVVNLWFLEKYHKRTKFRRSNCG